MDWQEAWMERQDTLLANLRREKLRGVINARRHFRREPRVYIGGENEMGRKLVMIH